jgi:hypothetical protein
MLVHGHPHAMQRASAAAFPGQTSPSSTAAPSSPISPAYPERSSGGNGAHPIPGNTDMLVTQQRHKRASYVRFLCNLASCTTSGAYEARNSTEDRFRRCSFDTPPKSKSVALSWALEKRTVSGSSVCWRSGCYSQPARHALSLHTVVAACLAALPAIF